MTPTAGTSYTPLSNNKELLSHPIQPGTCLFLNMSPYMQTSDFNLWTWTPEPWKVSTVPRIFQFRFRSLLAQNLDLDKVSSGITAAVTKVGFTTWKELEMGAVAEAVVLAVAFIYLGKTFSEKNCNLGLWQKQQGGGDHLEALGNNSNPFHCDAECKKKGQRWWHLAALILV